jgi:hypothetical protein
LGKLNAKEVWIEVSWEEGKYQPHKQMDKAKAKK